MSALNNFGLWNPIRYHAEPGERVLGYKRTLLIQRHHVR